MGGGGVSRCSGFNDSFSTPHLQDSLSVHLVFRPYAKSYEDAHVVYFVP
jgi:hypothetical protein